MELLMEHNPVTQPRSVTCHMGSLPLCQGKWYIWTKTCRKN